MTDLIETLRALAGGIVTDEEEKAMRDAAKAIATLTAERDEARLQVERCKTIINDYIKDIATQKAALIQARAMMARLHSKIQEFEAREQ